MDPLVLYGALFWAVLLMPYGLYLGAVGLARVTARSRFDTAFLARVRAIADRHH